MRRSIILICFLTVNPFAGSHLPDAANRDVMAYPQKVPELQSFASEMYRQFLSSHTVLTAKENVAVNRVNHTGNRVINAVKNYYTSKRSSGELDGFAWKINLVQENKKDAWCLPGGRIVVYSSLLPVTQSDASLAVILSHELAHIMLQHGDIRMKQYLKEYLDSKDLATAIASKPAETKAFFKMAYGTGDYVGVIRGFSEEDEMGADTLGLIFCAMAGFNPFDAIVFWKRMSGLKGTARQPELVSAHPVYEKRMTHLEEVMEDISEKYYKPIINNN